MNSQGTKHQSLIGLLFILLIFIPELNRQFSFISDYESTENRQLAPYPVLDLKNFSHYIKKFNAYYNDNFGLRNTLVSAHNFLNMKVFGISGVSYAIMGKNNWFFYDGSKRARDGFSFAGWQGRAPLSAANLTNITKNLEAHNISLRKRNITFIVMPCPDKHSIYSEYLPWRLNNVKGPSRLTQITEHVKLHGNFSFIDMKERLLQIKSEFHYLNTYYMTDSHWNNIGAFFAYAEIMKKLFVLHSKIKPYRLEHYIIDRNFQHQGDILNLAGISALHISDHRLIRNKNFSHDVGPKLGKLLVFGDSFYQGIEEYLLPHFSDIKFRWNPTNAYAPLDMNTVDAYSPTVVILQRVERAWTDL